MANQFPWHQFDRITFERGVCIKKHHSGEWFYLNSEDPLFISDPRTAVQSLGVRPVLAEGLNGSARVSFTLPAFRGRLLEIYRNELGLPASLKYLMGSMLYHCSALARLYAEECATFVEQYRLANVVEDTHSRENEKELAVHLEAPLYAVETMITKIIVGYESIRLPIWQKHGSSGNAPRTFVETVKRCDFPAALRKRVQMSTETCYLPAKSFRRCIQHHLESGASQWSRFEKRLPLLWSFTARLPDNPDETSAGALAFDRRLDALTVGWEYVSEFFAITDMLLGSGDLSTI